MKVDAIWDDEKGGGWKYKVPGVQGFLTPLRKSTSIVSSNEALVREAQAVAFAAGVKLPTNWELTVRR
jgi:hypothetical protein